MKFIRFFSFFFISSIIFSGCSTESDLDLRDKISQTDGYSNGDYVLSIEDQANTSSVLDEIPKIDIFSNNTPILCVGVQSDASPALSELPNFKSIMKKLDNLPYIKLGDKIEFELPPEVKESKIKVYDRILFNNGSDKYSTNVINIIDVDLADKKVSFNLDENKAAFLSSDLNDYAFGAIIRGFSFSLEINGQKYLYAFALRTDAS